MKRLRIHKCLTYIQSNINPSGVNHIPFNSIADAGVQAVFKHVPAHVGILDNEKAYILVKAVIERVHRAVALTAEELQNMILQRFTDDTVVE